MKRFIGLVGLSLLLMAALPLTTLAQFQGSIKLDMRSSDNVSMCSRDERAQETICDFSAGTKQIGLVVDYQGLPQSSIAVELRDERGIVIYFKTDTVNDSGSKTYTVSGLDVYNEYIRLAVDNSNQIIGKLSQTSMTPRGKMQEASPLVGPTIVILEQLERYGVAAAQGELASARDQLEVVFTKVKAVLETNLSTDAQNQAVAEALTAATQANTLIKAAKPKLEGRTDLAFLNVDTANGRKMTGKISRAGSQVDSIIWAVATSPIQRATAEPTRGPTNTPGPTSTAAPATATSASSPTPQPSATTAPSATPAPAVVNPTATTAAQATLPPTATTAPAAAITAVAPPPAATALRVPAQVSTTLPTSAATGVAQASAAGGAGTPGPAAKTQATATAGAAASDPAKSAAKTDAQPSATPTTARVAGKVDLGRLTPEVGDSRVAGQTSGGSLPWTTIALVVVAAGLGGAALWMRKRV